MKKILLYFPFILIIHLNAQTPCNEWVSSFGGSTSDIGWLIARDDLGNVYISGEYTSPVIYFGNDTIFNNGNMDAYILKINPDGIPQWCFTVGGSNEDRPRGLCTDLEGNIISAGRFYSPTLTIGDSVFINQGGSDIYLFKLNSDGEVIWARSFGSDGTIEFGFQVDVDSQNNIVMTGYYNGYSISFDSYILTNYEEGYDDMLVVKFDSSGNVLWARDGGGNNDDRGYRLTIDQSDNIYVSGHFGSSTMYMGPFSLVNTGSHDIFLAKYDSNGDEKWLKGVKGSGPDYPYDVAIDNFGSVYTTGYFESPFIKFDSHIIYNNGYIDLFLAKYDSLGNNVWARSFGGSGTDKAYDIDVDSLNNLYAIGYFNSSSISLDTITLYTNGMDDILTIKFNSDGDILAAKNYGGTQDDYGAGVVVFGEDELAITGSFKSSVIEFDTLTLNNQDYEDAFVYCINQLYPQAQFTYIIDGNTVTFQNTSLYADSYLWDFGDGNTSDEINPVHQYSESGYYDVTLVANNTCGSDSLIQVVYICDFPVSNFSCIIDSFTVVFENLSFYADSYIWDFGDGNVSTLENPVHTYELEGEYTVTLISINTCGSDTLIDLITICIQLIANFDQLINGLQVSFINLSQNADSYQWDFGDGNTSDEINPVHQYNESGYYDVTLVANNSCGSDSLTQVVYICDFPVSDFSYMIDSFTVVFENLSFFTDSYIWDFGDGNISTLENPVHTYELEGEYTVTLISINTCGSDTLSDLITICIPPIANFDQLFNGLQVSFINLSQNADSYQWDFGDGNTSEEINPVHIYQDGGNYFVTLQAYRDAGCYSEISQQLTVDSAIISHVVSIPNGWSGISSYVVPSDDTITHIFEPIVSEMYILMDGFGNVYWPDQGINTIYLWDSHHGYKIKTSDDLQLIIDGEIENNRTLNLYSGWNLIPVLSTQPVDCLELFEPLGDTLIIVKEIAGTNLYWPSENIYTLTLLLPGKAYLVYVIYNCTLTFTDTSYIAGQIYSPVTPKLVQPWNEIVKTGSSHIIAIYQNAMNKLQNGDIIGCFTESEVCAGLISIEDKTSSVAITVFGDDPTTFNVNEGFIEKESFHFRLYRESNDEIFDLNVQYDGNLPDLNVFKDNGLSVINGIELLISEYNDNSGLGSVLIYPNPAHNQITVQNATGFDNINVEISNLQGQILYQYNLFKPKEKINISSFEKGIYLIKVYTPVSSITKKIVKY